MRLLFAFLLFSSQIFAEVSESYSQKSVQVGEETTLKLSFETGDVVEWNLPEKGFIYSEADSETPIGELTDITQTPLSLSLHYVYFSSGNYKAQLTWTNGQGEKKESTEYVEVKSVLAGEKEALDIAEPIVFSGTYLLRLLIVIILALTCLAGIAYILFYYKNKKKSPIKDAIFEPVNKDNDSDFYKKKLQSLILDSEISHKEFIFHLSGYIKERIGTKLQSSILHLTQAEVHEILQSDYRVPNVELLTIDNYFNSIKYMPNEEKIQRDNALSLIKYWDKILTR